jgi:Transposase family tnp2
MDDDDDFLYPGALITLKQSEALILSYVTRYHLSENALRDLLMLINSHTPQVVHRSRYFFLKDLNQDQTVSYCWYCECCQGPLKFPENNPATTQCTNDGCDLYQLDQEQSKLQQSGCFFLHMPLRPQLVALLNDNSVYTKLRKDRYNSDVPSGKIYRDYEHQQKIMRNDITLQWNTDGASATKSTKCSIWPIQVAVNEIPYKERKQHLMLTSLWQGDKPCMDTFLRPFVDELIDLHVNGIQLANGTSVKVHCLVASVDSVARPLLQNIKQFNGDYGCSFCLKKGERVTRGAGTSHVYCGEVEEFRNADQHLHDATEAIETKTCVNGVKGPSTLMLIPLFNIITSFTPDYLHNILLGVVKWFLCEWFDSKNSNEEWYLGSRHKSEIFEARLLSIRPPSEITRVPRSFVLDKKLWKASEFRSFLLYYSLPCLYGLLPGRFFKHWMLLVLAISIFLKEKIDACDLQLATRALKTFVLQTEELYDKEWMTFNLHMLLHVPNSVENWGALWGSSTFIYEHFNGVLLNLFSGTQHISNQIFRNYNRVKKMNRVINSTGYQNWHPMAEKLLKNLAGKYLSVRALKINSLVVFGAARHVALSVFEEIALETLFTDNLVAPIDLNEVTCYMRFHVNGIMCNTSNYTRLQKRRNDCVRLSNGNFFKIENLLYLGDNIPVDFKYICVGKELKIIMNSDLCSDGQFKSSKFLYKINNVISRTIAIYPRTIISKCVLINVEDQDFVCELVNSYERD